jgi:hypothetical protein
MSKMLSKHPNTIAKWCDAIEGAGVYRFERINDERVFNEQDECVIQYINDKRDDKYSMQQIILQLPVDMDIKPHVLHMSATANDVPEVEIIKQQIIDGIQHAIDKAVAIQIQQVKEHYEHLVAALPKPQDESELQSSILSAFLLKEQIEQDLRDEAIEKWREHPERQKRMFLWMYKEDIEKRDLYVNQYIKEHLFDRVKKHLKK